MSSDSTPLEQENARLQRELAQLKVRCAEMAGDPADLRRQHRTPTADAADPGLIEQAPIGIFAYHAGRFAYVNRSLANMLGYTTHELLEREQALEIFADKDRFWINASFERLLDGYGKPLRQTVRVLKGDGSPIELECHARLGDYRGSPAIIGVMQEQSSTQPTQIQVNRLAFYDSLTGLPAKPLFFDRIYQTISQSRRRNVRFGLLMLDLDGFKAVNDGYGHAAGDSLLKQVAQRLRRCVRDSDPIARIGGDEFTLILRDIDHVTDASRVAQKIIDTLELPFSESGQNHHIGASIGISIFPDDGDTIETLMLAADHAMYQSKREGKNTFRRFLQPPSSEFASTPVLPWTNDYLVNVVEIDAQHRVLHEKINGVFAGINAGLGFDDLLLLLRDLADYAEFHFRTEETYMSQSGVPDLQQHKYEHQKLLAEIEQVMKQIEHGSVMLLQEFLKGWAIEHVLNFDSKYIGQTTAAPV